jgi:hypothetical protein
MTRPPSLVLLPPSIPVGIPESEVEARISATVGALRVAHEKEVGALREQLEQLSHEVDFLRQQVRESGMREREREGKGI